MDKAGKEFWNDFWRGKKLPPPINLAGRGPRTWFYQNLHRLWQAHLPPRGSASWRVLEVGCARSRWLIYFAREWGFEVAGLDYCELGCELARALLAREGVPGRIFHQDLFSPAPELVENFDVVFSNGVVEHFSEPARVLRQMATFLKPGGLILTIIPNFTGWLGRLQQLLGPEILALHNLLCRESLAAAHREAGLKVLSCDYVAFLHFSVIHPGKRFGGWRRRGLFKLLKGATGVSAGIYRLLPVLPVNRRTAGFIVTIAAKFPGSQEKSRAQISHQAPAE